MSSEFYLFIFWATKYATYMYWAITFNPEYCIQTLILFKKIWCHSMDGFQPSLRSKQPLGG